MNSGESTDKSANHQTNIHAEVTEGYARNIHTKKLRINQLIHQQITPEDASGDKIIMTFHYLITTKYVCQSRYS